MKINPEQLETLSLEEKRLLLAELIKKKTGDPARSTSSQEIPLQNRENSAFPLSFGQQRLWFLDQLDPGNHVYNLPIFVHLKGKLDVIALEKSLNKVIARQESLQTNFPMLDGEPTQVIVPNRALSLTCIDLSYLSYDERTTRANQLLEETARQPFDLTSDMLVRSILIQLDTDHHLFLLTIHHIVADGWSLGHLVQELAMCYKELVTGEPVSLPNLPIQYIDFACWQRMAFDGEMLADQLAYWKKQLGGELTTLALPLDYPRPPIQTFRGGRKTVQLSAKLTADLRRLSQQQGATLFMTLLAAFKLLLSRYTGQTDILIGSPIAGRTRPEIEKLVGMFVNTLVLRTDLSGDISFRELINRVRKVALEAYRNQDIPFEYLLAELHPERDQNRTPLFQVFFNMLTMFRGQIELPDLAIEIPTPPEVGSIFDLTLYANDQNETINLILVFNADLFALPRMEEMLAQYEHLLEQIVATPDEPLRVYSLVTERSRHLLPDPGQVLPEPAYELLPHMIMAQASRNPKHPAIRQDDQVWSYEDLVEASKALTQLLLTQGVEQGEVIAVCGSRSFGLIASIISVFLGGGVLLTLDQNLPPHRQRVMLQTAKAKRLFYVGTKREDDEWMWASLNVTRIEPSTGRAINVIPNQTLSSISLPELDPDAAAYIFFTSGTTGTPKGILGCQKGLAHFLDWQRQTFEVGPQDRSAQLTGLSFDVVLRDIFLPLTSGATLCLPSPEASFEPAYILPWLEREQISLLHTVPSLVQSWLINVPAEVSLRQLRWVFSAGEPLTEILIRQWRKAFPETGGMVNIYGPTETTLAKCFYLVPTETVLSGIQPVGSPLPETQALVLTKDQQLCGIGEPGEIVIRTPFRSLGYINAPEENEQRFVKNPFRTDSADLIYLTGDRGRYRPDGLLEILGRMDHQVKIRGVRIEPDEITSVLSQHSAVHQAVVVPREDSLGEKSLVGYIVPVPKESPTVSDLNRFLRQRLPEYMVPSAFVLLEALPLTPNKKLDRKALPAPDQTRPELEVNFVAPTSPLERLIAEVWQEVLDVERVGVYDNFFDLGGHSLLVVRAMAKLEQKTGAKLPLAYVTYQTLGQLAAMYEEQLSPNISKSTEHNGNEYHQEHVDTAAVSIEIHPKNLSNTSLMPFYFGPSDKFIFGCYHPPQAERVQNSAVVLCYPQEHEYIRSHRAYQQLANLLARAGFPVLRFDYTGCGDSYGETDEGYFDQWLSDISLAIDTIKTRSGLQQVTLAGLRLGATLAALASTQYPEILNLVLWEPIIKGPAYLEELAEQHQDTIWRFPNPPKNYNVPNPPTELLGFPFTQSIADNLRGLDLLAIRPENAKNSLIIDGQTEGRSKSLRQHFQHIGIPVEYRYIPSFNIWLEDPDKGLVPYQTLQAIISWIFEVQA